MVKLKDICGFFVCVFLLKVEEKENGQLRQMVHFSILPNCIYSLYMDCSPEDQADA